MKPIEKPIQAKDFMTYLLIGWWYRRIVYTATFFSFANSIRMTSALAAVYFDN